MGNINLKEMVFTAHLKNVSIITEQIETKIVSHPYFLKENSSIAADENFAIKAKFKRVNDEDEFEISLLHGLGRKQNHFIKDSDILKIEIFINEELLFSRSILCAKGKCEEDYKNSIFELFTNLGFSSNLEENVITGKWQ